MNGIYNLKKNELLPFSDVYRFFAKLPVEFDPYADCPAIKKFFKDIVESEKDYIVMQELFGYILLRRHPIEKAFMFLGGGRNGKSKCLEVMKNFVGQHNCANVPLQTIEKDQYAVSNLWTKMANLSADLSKEALKNTGMFKSITGNDLISANRKFKSNIDFVNYSKQIFCCNTLPMTDDITHAFFDRWVIIDFPFTFSSQEEIDDMDPADVDKYIKIRDTEIIDKIVTIPEISGLFNWAILGLERIKKEGRFSCSTSTEKTRQKWLKKADSLQSFIDDCCVVTIGVEMLKSDFKIEYETYCVKNKLQSFKGGHIKSKMEELGIYEERKSLGRFWDGIELMGKKLFA